MRYILDFMQKYDPKAIEPKWQEYWDEHQTYRAETDPSREKFFGLIEFPYPSGAGLHVGHPRSNTAMDVITRYHRMNGKNVLFPIGFDSFGLPTENFAIKTGRPPKEITDENIATFTRQLKALGFGFDWSRAVTTSEPEYYKWTQWIFLQLYKQGLAYKTNQPINWCPKDKIGLANEEVVDGCCERCGNPVEKRNKEQWMLAITKYADKLLAGLNEVDYISRARTQQENWIGRSEGVNLKFKIEGTEKTLEVFTTRLDTIFSGTFIVLAPENPLVAELTTADNQATVDAYIKETAQKTDIERTDINKEKTGAFTGSYAINPATDDRMPIWISDFVLGQYGTGAVFADAHDERDFEMAKKFGILLKVSLRPADDAQWERVSKLEECFSAEGVLVNSAQFDGLSSAEAREKIADWLSEKGAAERKVQYKLRDWVFSRQRYWGEPIPLVHCEKCAGWVPLPEDQLPLTLPEVEKYLPTDTGESPLAAITEWVNTTCPQCGGPARRETDTMPNWAGSSWYFLRYTDPKNDKELASKEALKYWTPVDWYNGGMEHTVLHLLYSRFWNQFLFDIGVVPTLEPYKKRTSHGMILAKGGEKMSKSKGNVVNPDEMVDQYGADALRTYIMFMGPFDQAVEWDTNGLVGVRRFLDKVWNLQDKVSDSGVTNTKVVTQLHQTIKKVTDDIANMSFNTSVAKLMELANAMTAEEKIAKTDYQIFIKLLSVFAPHIAEELWAEFGDGGSVALASWPQYDVELAKSSEVTVVVQVNGKVRAELVVSPDIAEADIKAQALAHESVQKWLEGREPKKIIYVPGRLVSIVV